MRSIEILIEEIQRVFPEEEDFEDRKKWPLQALFDFFSPYIESNAIIQTKHISVKTSSQMENCRSRPWWKKPML